MIIWTLAEKHTISTYSLISSEFQRFTLIYWNFKIFNIFFKKNCLTLFYSANVNKYENCKMVFYTYYFSSIDQNKSTCWVSLQFDSNLNISINQIKFRLCNSSSSISFETKLNQLKRDDWNFSNLEICEDCGSQLKCTTIEVFFGSLSNTNKMWILLYW
jgi:hypothetical protein